MKKNEYIKIPYHFSIEIQRHEMGKYIILTRENTAHFIRQFGCNEVEGGSESSPAILQMSDSSPVSSRTRSKCKRSLFRK